MHTNTSLPTCLSREIHALLCDMLPPPAPDTPDARAARVAGATTAAAALQPGDPFEARLATRIVAMDAHAADCLRLAGLATADPAEMRRCRAQAASMARQAESALRSLLRIQANREKQEAAMHPAAMARAGYWFRDASVPASAPPPDPAAAPQAATQPEPALTDAAAEAERYAVIYPDRAARIRSAGGLPARLDFGPPEPDIVAALLSGTGHPHRDAAEQPSHDKRRSLVNSHSETFT